LAGGQQASAAVLIGELAPWVTRFPLRARRTALFLVLSLVGLSSTYVAVTPQGTLTGGPQAIAISGDSSGGHDHLATLRAVHQTFSGSAGTTGRAPLMTLPLAVDGEKTPHLIPDRLAFHHFLIATAVASTSAPNDVARRDFMLARAGLSTEERHVFAIALAGVKDKLNEIEGKRRAAQYNTPGVSEQLKVRQNQILDDARARVQAALDKGAMARLDAYVQGHVKSRIKIFGEPPVMVQ